MKKLRKIPKFRNEDQERAFWATHSIVDYVDLKTAQRASFPNLKPSLRTISIRLPVHLISTLKTLANERDMPYQALLKQLLADRVAEELHKRVA